MEVMIFTVDDPSLTVFRQARLTRVPCPGEDVAWDSSGKAWRVTRVVHLANCETGCVAVIHVSPTTPMQKV